MSEAKTGDRRKIPHIHWRFFVFYGDLSGANSRDRTDDLRITNALLYQLSYVGKKTSGYYDTENKRRVNSRLHHHFR
jgi:hypothetical protein